MLDIRKIKDNPRLYRTSLKRRGVEIDTDLLIKLYNNYLSSLQSLQELQNERNKISQMVGEKKQKGEDTTDIQNKVLELKEQIALLQTETDKINLKIKKNLELLPNLPSLDCPDGLSEEDNVLVRSYGKIKKLDYKVKSHEIIGNQLGMMDFDIAAKLSGSRFVILKNDLAKMERALANFMIDYHINNNEYQEVNPPSLVNDTTMYGTGQLPKFSDDLFRVDSGHWLIPTAEVPLTNMFSDEIINKDDLPMRFTALTNCFRSEAGAAGKDTKGMIRLHEFKKVELVSIVNKEESDNELKRMLDCAEKILQQLVLPYRVVDLCCGDLGFSAKQTYDLEVWIPSQNKYREISSCSNCGDFQSKRMNTRIKNDTKEIEYAYTLNGSGVAVGRALVAIIENYQEEDGSIIVPDVLVPYMGGVKKIKRKV